MFNIAIGDCVVAEKLDVLAKAGGRLWALNQYFPVKVEDNNVWFNGRKCQNGYSPQSKSVILSFVPTGVDNPMVSGIVLFKGTLDGPLTRD